MAETKFNLIRVEAAGHIQFFENAREHFGAQSDTGYNIPNLFRALAHPVGPADFVRAPQQFDDERKYHADSTEFDTARAYWTSLGILLVYSFGWRFPGLGLKRWVDAGMPTEDDRFALIVQVWVQDGQFDAFCAWLWNQNPYVSDFGQCLLEDEQLQESSVPPHTGLASEAWLERVANQFAYPFPNPFTGGGDPLHLGHHIASHSEEDRSHPARQYRLAPSADGRTADLFVNSMQGWHRLLSRVGNTLVHPEKGRSVRVTVHCPHVGTLGEFRRSRETGIWFSGPHSSHMLGN